ncbi:hypothetical protein EDC26_110118 [Paralcaligenes ureilyticus]|uniref:Uncharacterized protein n=1 Tax=Paralcaligenes ureilyticus TaxID=627131 RepID=A0A4V6NZJ7_9BURK|nr:hypothetical protein EDC26_110118 [Paralcaligenes ureilyticus]
MIHYMIRGYVFVAAPLVGAIDASQRFFYSKRHGMMRIEPSPGISWGWAIGFWTEYAGSGR